MDIIKDNLPELAKNNYKYMEIIMGNKITNNIFDSRINKKKFDIILNNFKKKLNSSTCNQIKSKNYYVDNVRLNINKTGQQRCFRMTLLDWKVLNKKQDFLINFGERQMVSIENFPTLYKYNNEVMREIISYNIKNKFYLNFICDEINKKLYYSISLFMTKKNGKSKEILELISTYLELLESF